MAAGLTIAADKLTQFEQAFTEIAEKTIADELLTSVIYSDGELSASELSMELAEILQQAGPWGQAFPEPVFHGNFRLLQQRLLGEKHLKLVLQASDGKLLDAIWFNVTTKLGPIRMCSGYNSLISLISMNFVTNKICS